MKLILRHNVILLLLLSLVSIAMAGEIHDAVRRGNIAQIKMLLDKNPKLVNEKESDGATLLYYAKDPRMAEFLIKRGAKINVKNGSGETPLHNAALWGRLEIAKVLVKHGAHVNIRDDRKCTPLHIVAFTEGCSDYRIAELLINHKADVNVRDIYGMSPLHGAASFGRIFLAKLLIKSGAIVNAKDKKGMTPLHYATKSISPINNSADMTKLLIIRGADVNAKDKMGENPLHKLVKSYSSVEYEIIVINVARILISNNANVNARITAGKDKGKTPLKIAKEKGLKRLAEYLRKKGGKE